MMGNYYLRAVFFVGGLYLVEVYLIFCGIFLLFIGLYNYQVKIYFLFKFWDNRVWLELQDVCFWYFVLENIKLAIVIIVIFYCFVWCYEDWVYR